MRTDTAKVGSVGRRRDRRSQVVVTALGLSLLVAVSLLLRTRALRAGFWIDEGLSVGIASHDFFSIPGVLRVDGSPPFYYMVLHVWMSIFGQGEGATHGLSVVSAVATVPVAFFGARRLAGLRSGVMAATLAALHPFLTYFAQETRMYALLALLTLGFAIAWAGVFGLRDRRFLAPAAILGALALYTHNWAAFVLVGSVLGVVVLSYTAAAGGRILRDAALLYGGIALLFAPWLPTLVFQVRNTGAPWANVPSFKQLIDGFLAVLGGGGAGPVLLVIAGAGIVALLGRPLGGVGPVLSRDEATKRTDVVLGLSVMLIGGFLVAWLVSQVSPAWATRYFATFVGPAVLLAGIGLAHTRTLGVAVLVLIVFLWADPRTAQLQAKSNVRSVAASIEYRQVATGDLIISTHPEQIAVLHYYLGDRFRYATSLGPQDDPRYLDWTNVLDRLSATPVTSTARSLVDGIQPGRAVILVQPILRSYRWRAPWTRLVKRRSVAWERALNADPRLRRVESFPRFGLRPVPRGVRAVLYRVRTTPPSSVARLR